MTKQQHEALQYATALRSNSVFFTPKYMGFIADELERLHARLQELEADNQSLRGINEDQDKALAELEKELSAAKDRIAELEASQAQRAPLSDEDKHRLVIEWSYSSESTGSDFLDGVNYAEKAHGITKEQKK